MFTKLQIVFLLVGAAFCLILYVSTSRANTRVRVGIADVAGALYFATLSIFCAANLLHMTDKGRITVLRYGTHTYSGQEDPVMFWAVAAATAGLCALFMAIAYKAITGKFGRKPSKSLD